MPEDIGYTDDQRSLAESLMGMGKVDPDEFLAKISEMGFSLEKGGMSPLGDEDSGMMDEGPPMDEPSDEPPMDEPPEESHDEPPDHGPGGLNLVILRKKAAKNAMGKHGH